MFNWLSNLFMSTTAEAALEIAIYSAGVASGGGMYQIKEPENLRGLAMGHEKYSLRKK